LPVTYRHCERSEAIQRSRDEALDCFVTSFPAMTKSYYFR
jgi:hypothetical protein